MAEKATIAGGRPAVVIAVCGLALLVSGCAYSLSEFAREPSPQASTTAAVAPAATGAAVPLQPVALVDEGPAQPLPLRQPAPPVMATGSLPPPTASATEPDSALLTPEEKAKVIAELEALAKSQNVTPPPAAPQTKCQDETLDAAERLRREVEGIAC